ncbi:MAG: DUF1573 domain-containing protein, partial [Acidobacteriota bacterium]
MKTLLGALLISALSVVASSEADAGKGQKKPATGPRLEVTPEVHDFGKVEQNRKLVKEFQIENTGSEDLIIGRISTSCGCTAALTSDKLVEPGKTATLQVTLETRKYKGAIQRSVSI